MSTREFTSNSYPSNDNHISTIFSGIVRSCKYLSLLYYYDANVNLAVFVYTSSSNIYFSSHETHETDLLNFAWKHYYRDCFKLEEFAWGWQNPKMP